MPTVGEACSLVCQTVRAGMGKIQMITCICGSSGMKLPSKKPQCMGGGTNPIRSRSLMDMATNYRRLLDAEIINLDEGESDLFKLNIQTDKYIDSQLKFLKTSASLQKAKAELVFEAGYPFMSLISSD